MAVDLTISPAALWEARRNGGTLPAPARTWSEQEAYALQEELITGAEMPLAGWKVGATGKGAPKALGLSGPLAGPLWPDVMVGAEEPLALHPAHRPQAEVELAVRFDVRPVAATEHAVLSAIGAVTLAIEITGSRLERETDPAGPGFVADHGGAGHVVLGPWNEPPPVATWADISARLWVDGSVRKAGTGRNVLGSPMNALLWLVGHLAGRSRAVAPGDVVITGAMAGLTPFPIGATLTAEVPGFETVRIRTSEMRR